MVNRFDPDRNFKFKVAGVALVALAGFGLVRKLVRRSRSRALDPKDYIPKEPPPLPPPIIPVGTTTAGRRASRGRAASRPRAGGTKKR